MLFVHGHVLEKPVTRATVHVADIVWVVRDTVADQAQQTGEVSVVQDAVRWRNHRRPSCGCGTHVICTGPGTLANVPLQASVTFVGGVGGSGGSGVGVLPELYAPRSGGAGYGTCTISTSTPAATPAPLAGDVALSA